MPAKKKTTPNKSNFIRQQPATLSAADVIAAGKKVGLKISSSLVYMVRGRVTKPKKAVDKKTTATKTTMSSSKAPITSKADFVRSRSHLSPKEIVEDAKAGGLKLDVGYVYNVRGADKAKTKVTKLAARRSTERTASPVARPITIGLPPAAMRTDSGTGAPRSRCRDAEACSRGRRPRRSKPRSGTSASLSSAE